ncbi:hypothetical protein AGMMS49579_03870 [Spirochaetia bacterium]|nr:hypothetical protein AGMMS49579_03870 [Spirochaetia bacterium]
MTIVCIDGNIGSGKSTLIKSLKKSWTCFTEPIDKWSLLPFLYEDMLKYASVFHYQVLLSFWDQFNEFKNINDIVIIERCPWTVKNIFVEMIKHNYMKPYMVEAFNDMYNILSYDIDYYIYLDVSTDVAMKRIISRDRFAERNIQRNYIEALHNQYIMTIPFIKCKKYEINADKSIAYVEDEVIKILTDIKC